LVFRLEIGVDVGLLSGILYANGVGGGFGGLERVSHSESDVLAVVANDIILEWWAPLVTDAIEARSQDRTVNRSDILTMKNGSHAGHFLGRRRVKLKHPALG